jgi:hypothetical protein
MENIVNSLPEFDPIRDLPDHFLIIMYGMRRSGKTVMLKHMLESLHERLQFHEVYLFCGTADVNPDQYEFIPKSARFSDVENLEYHLRKLWDHQTEAKRKKRESDKAANKKSDDRKKLFDSDSDDEDSGKVLITQPREVGSRSRRAAMKEILDPEEYNDKKGDYHPVLIIMDDCVSEDAVRRSPTLKKIAIGGRHIDISIIILSQCVCGSASVPPAVRTQSDVVITVAQPRSRVEREMIAEQYLTAENRQGSKADALEVLNKITSVQHRALVVSTIDSAARSHLDFAYKYGPVPFPPCSEEFKLGTQEQWDLVLKKKKTDNKNLPNPFKHGLDLPKDYRSGEYLNGISDDLWW